MPCAACWPDHPPADRGSIWLAWPKSSAACPEFNSPSKSLASDAIVAAAAVALAAPVSGRLGSAVAQPKGPHCARRSCEVLPLARDLRRRFYEAISEQQKAGNNNCQGNTAPNWGSGT